MELVVLAGLQASGKSSFYKERFFGSHMRINLDQLRTRSREGRFIATCFETSMPFVVDNTNPSRADRIRYLSEAKDRGYRCILYFFESRLADCLGRNAGRTGKAFIPEVGLRSTSAKLEIPDRDEGWDDMYFVCLRDGDFLVEEWRDEI